MSRCQLKTRLSSQYVDSPTYHRVPSCLKKEKKYSETTVLITFIVLCTSWQQDILYTSIINTFLIQGCVAGCKIKYLELNIHQKLSVWQYLFSLDQSKNYIKGTISCWYELWTFHIKLLIKLQYYNSGLFRIEHCLLGIMLL